MAALVLSAAAFGFLAAGAAADRAAATIASWQLFPALDRAILTMVAGTGAAGLIAFTLILLATALCGRWYCAFLCPLGILQDLASLVRGKRRKYRKPVPFLRALSLAAAAALAVSGATGLAAWLDPWSIFSRFMAYDLQSLARLARGQDLLGFQGSLPLAIASGAVVVAMLAASAASGRWFCGTLCPVGTALGALASVAPIGMRIDPGSCVSCGACASACRASCIDAKAKRVDPSRCVNCLACLGSCPTGALRYGARRGFGKQAKEAKAPTGYSTALLQEVCAGPAMDMDRARFLRLAGSGAATIAMFLVLPGKAFASGSKSGTAPGAGPSIGPAPPVLPPGARSADSLLKSCVACGLCVSRCPSRVLQPALGQLGLRGLMMPLLDHSISYCQFDCTVCMDVCPSAALERLGREGKHLAKIGDASLERARCVVFTNGTKCGACAEHCPTGAVRMVAGETGLPEPVFTSSICIGCGACHHACPVRPERAISVSGLAVQSVADKPSEGLFDAPGSSSGSGTPVSGDGGGAEAFPF
jgi:ferredoxin